MAKEIHHDLTQTIGGCGRFQGLLTAAVYSIIAVSVWGHLMMSFGNFNPGWTCLDREYGNGSDALFLEKSENRSQSHWSTDCTIKSSCTYLLYNKDSSTVVSEWDITCDRSWISSMIISIQLIGTLLGCGMSGQIGDRFGRTVSIYLHLGLYTITLLVAAFSVSWQMYASLLFFLGYSGGGILATCYPFPLEFVNASWRGIISALPVWSIGFVAFSLTAWLLRDWKQLHFAATAISALALLTVCWTPESVRWLTVRGKIDKAKKTVSRIARINNHPCPNVRIIDEIAKDEKDRVGDHNYTYLDLFRISSLRSNSIKLGVVWAIMGLIYFTVIFGTKALSGNFYLNLTLSALIEIPVVFLIPVAVNNLGRRVSALIFFFAEAVGCYALALMYLAESAQHITVLVLALFCKMLVIGIWAIFAVFSAEVFPTIVRSMLFGYINSLARVGAVISPFLIPNDSDKIYIPFVVIGSFALIACGVIWSLPETKGRALRDTAKDDMVLELHIIPGRIDV